MSRYIPDEGDVVWIQLDPTIGREQAGHRPAVVLTPKSYNGRSGMMFCVPMTTKLKGYPFEVAIGSGDDRAVALVDQSRSIDWKQRGVRRKDKLTKDELSRVRTRLRSLTGEP